MSTTYSAIGLSSFVKKVKEGLNSRLDEFYRDTLNKNGGKGDVKLVPSRTIDDWFELYKEWSKDNLKDKEVQKMLEQYVLNGFD